MTETMEEEVNQMESEDAGVKLLVKVSDGEFLEVRARALYTSVEEAARIAGVAYERMSEWANSRTDPIPHIPVGRSKKLIRVSAIPGYAMGKEHL